VGRQVAGRRRRPRDQIEPPRASRAGTSRRSPLTRAATSSSAIAASIRCRSTSKHRDAREILDALLARADVVLINMRPGLAAELGVEYEQLAPRHPRFDRRQRDGLRVARPDAALAGMDMVVQARSGSWSPAAR